MSASPSPNASSSLGPSRCCIVVLGAGGVGKSALSIQYVQGVFVNTYDPTIMDSLLKVDTIDNQHVAVTVVDTAGQAEYADHRVPYVRSADVCVFVFSVTDPLSFSQILPIFEHSLQSRTSASATSSPPKSNTRMPFVVVGNKADLAAQRCITEDQGKRLSLTLASKLGLSESELTELQQHPPYMETTALHRESASQMFRHSVAFVLQFRKLGTFSAWTSALAVMREVDSEATMEASASLVDVALAASSGTLRKRGSNSWHNDEDDEGSGPMLVLPQIEPDGSHQQQALRSKPSSPTSIKKKKKKSGFKCLML